MTGCILTGRDLSAFICERIAAREYNNFVGLVRKFSEAGLFEYQAYIELYLSRNQDWVLHLATLEVLIWPVEQLDFETPAITCQVGCRRCISPRKFFIVYESESYAVALRIAQAKKPNITVETLVKSSMLGCDELTSGAILVFLHEM